MFFFAKLYFYQSCTSTCTVRPIRNPDLTKCQRTEVEVERSEYRKGRTDAYQLIYDTVSLVDFVDFDRILISTYQKVFVGNIVIDRDAF